MISELHKCWIEVTLKYLGDCDDVDGGGSMVIKDFEIKKIYFLFVAFKKKISMLGNF